MSRPGRAPVAVLALMFLAAPLGASAPAMAERSPILQRFFSAGDHALTTYRALRHLEAHNDKFEKGAWMDVWTEVDPAATFTYAVVAQGGSEYIRDHVLLAALDTERRTWQQHGTDRVALTPDNYVFEDRGPCSEGLVTFGVKPRRRDQLLVDGSIFIRPDDAALVRLEGELAKSPSFWTRHVHVVRWFDQIAGARVPVATESVATVLLAGRSTFRMTYEYEMVNGQKVGEPKLEVRR